MFAEKDEEEDHTITKIEDWKFEERLSKEFEAVGFFVSNHPLNQFKEIFNDYKIVDYLDFNTKNDIKTANIAATLLKIQERKTSKGTSYAVIKLTDLSSVFELFIFSDVLDLNRNILKEGNSLILTLVKNNSIEENRFRRVNVQKIASLKNLFNSPISKITFSISSKKQIDIISAHLTKKGDTTININYLDGDQKLIFHLRNKRHIDRKSINLIRNDEISAIIE